jgi:hypothetical protein
VENVETDLPVNVHEEWNNDREARWMRTPRAGSRETTPTVLKS